MQEYGNHRVLVTGGAGFIGSNLAAALARAGAHVTIIDDLSSGKRENLPAEARFLHASILDRDALDDACRGCEVVFHLAAMVSVPESVARPDDCVACNILGTQIVLDAALRAGARRVVQATSAAAYGASPELPSTENSRVDPQSPYAASKIAAELLGSSFCSCHPDFSVVSLRYFNVYGPGQDPRSPYAAAISAFLDRLSGGKPVTVYGDGLQTRDFVFVDDVVRANMLAGIAQRELRGHVFNIATGRAATLLTVVSLLADALGVTADVTHAPPRAGDVRHSRAAVSQAASVLGFSASVPLEAGLRALAAASGRPRFAPSR